MATPAAVGEREVGLAGELGFASAVTTRHGVLLPSTPATCMALPRISVNGRYQSLGRIRTMLSGRDHAARQPWPPPGDGLKPGLGYPPAGGWRRPTIHWMMTIAGSTQSRPPIRKKQRCTTVPTGRAGQPRWSLAAMA